MHKSQIEQMLRYYEASFFMLWDLTQPCQEEGFSIDNNGAISTASQPKGRLDHSATCPHVAYSWANPSI